MKTRVTAAEAQAYYDLLEATVELPAEVIKQQVEEIRRRALINAGLVRPMGELEEGFLTRRQAS